jgi:hypothetical protein
VPTVSIIELHNIVIFLGVRNLLLFLTIEVRLDYQLLRSLAIMFLMEYLIPSIVSLSYPSYFSNSLIMESLFAVSVNMQSSRPRS